MEREARLLEIQFKDLVAEVLPALFGPSARIDPEVRLSDGGRPDFVVDLGGGQSAIVEVKTDTPSTTSRLEAAQFQLEAYASGLAARSHFPPQLVLIVPGALTNERKHGDRSRIRIIDGPQLRGLGPDLPWPEAVARVRVQAACADEARLSYELRSLPPGRAHWSKYQTIVRDILRLVLTPPLESPIEELSNRMGVNRRDVIMPNYAVDGFWHFLRNHYSAHFVVVEAKNYTGPIKKNQVLQVANYLSEPGTGLFGIIACRTAGDRSAEITRREQWILHRKLIVVLNDADFDEMLALNCGGQEPSAVIRQKIEDFRLGY
ncbi:hypothetical protein [Agrococcus beijingensis]|uniref:hypothetical protein n=1 Tax=Agrococcus beijingensis TaxID=3068634 RepID=UPI0027418E72|nr:hypothetical protein [Agrococcus sp. REN33]